ncbi:MAG: glycosyltransferase [Clostridiaceae bacterium]
MKKIVYILHGLASGGTENFVLNVVRRLDKTQYDISFILAVDDDNVQFLESEALDEGVRIYKACDLDGIFKKVKYCMLLYRLLKETGEYDVVHSNMDMFNGVNLAIAKAAGIKKRISHSHISHSQYAVKPLRKLMVLPYQHIMRILIKKFSTLRLGCSQKANVYLYGEKWSMDDNTSVLYNGIDIDKFMNPGIDKSQFMKGISMDPDKINIATVGRISAPKNPLFIVEIINELSKINKNFCFTWVGKGEMESQVRDLINKNGISKYFNFLGTRRDIPEILNCCDIFMLPSLFEGLSISLIEAQAAGLDCFISSTIQSEVDAGKCIALDLEKGAQFWAEKINEHISAETEKCLDMEKLSKFNVVNTVEALEEIYI